MYQKRRKGKHNFSNTQPCVRKSLVVSVVEGERA